MYVQLYLLLICITESESMCWSLSPSGFSYHSVLLKWKKLTRWELIAVIPSASVSRRRTRGNVKAGRACLQLKMLIADPVHRRWELQCCSSLMWCWQDDRVIGTQFYTWFGKSKITAFFHSFSKFWASKLHVVCYVVCISKSSILEGSSENSILVSW